MPFKANRERRHRIPKQRYRVTNWATYDASLRARDSLTVWFTAEAMEAWKAESCTSRAVRPPPKRTFLADPLYPAATSPCTFSCGSMRHRKSVRVTSSGLRSADIGQRGRITLKLRHSPETL
jgi:hypothetical protein